MYPRTNYEMTEADFEALMNASKSMPVMMIGGYASASPQENANRAWAALGEKMGFDYMTVQPIQGKGSRFFTAVPSETDQQRSERLAHEKEEARKAEIARLTAGIADFQRKLADLQKGD